MSSLCISTPTHVILPSIAAQLIQWGVLAELFFFFLFFVRCFITFLLFLKPCNTNQEKEYFLKVGGTIFKYGSGIWFQAIHYIELYLYCFSYFCYEWLLFIYCTACSLMSCYVRGAIFFLMLPDAEPVDSFVFSHKVMLQ